MANFLPMNSSPFGQMNLYTPDWSFLTTVMGTRQAEYDRGFNIAKSHYDNLKYAALTNPENMEQREYAFKQLENNIKSITNLDLSKGENINKALDVMNPISEDKAIVYDMAYTKAMASERSKMEAIKNSTDPEVRKLYNRYSEMEMGYADLNMQEAHRNDGSIFEIKPVKHVAYRDYIGDLDKKMKDAGISIKASNVTGDGYIIETKNGPMSIPYFNSWAQMQMGDQYDEQFAVMGRVQTETAIRNTMDTYGVDRKSAQAYVAEQLAPILADKEAQKELAYNEAYKNTSTKLNIFKQDLIKAGINGVPASKYPEYQALQQELATLEKISENAALEKIKLQDPSYILSNMSYYFGNSAKDQHIQKWASSTAMATMEESIKDDNVWLTKYKESQTNWRHAQRLEFDMYKFNTEMQYKMDTEGVKQNADGTYTKTGVNSVTEVGNYTSDKTLFKADILEQTRVDAENNLYNTTINSDDGLLNMIIRINSGDDELSLDTFTNYQQTLNGLKEYADKGGILPYWNKENLGKIKQMIIDLGLNAEAPVFIPNGAGAAEYLNYLNTAIYEKASEIIEKNPNAVNVNADLYKGLVSTKEAVDNNLQILNDTYAFWDKAGPEMMSSGMFYLSSMNIVGFTPNGNPIMNTAQLTDAQKSILDKIAPDDIMSGVAVTKIQNIVVSNPNSISRLLNEDIIKPNTFKGTGSYDDDIDDIIEMFQKNPEVISTEFGNSIDVAYDPVDKSYIFSLKPGESKDKKNVKSGSITFKVDESAIESIGILRDTYSNIKNTSQLPSTMLGGEWGEMLNNKYHFIESDPAISAQGFKYIIKANNNGGYTMEYAFQNPNGSWTKGQQSRNESTPQESLVALKATVSQLETYYLASKKTALNNQYQAEEIIPF
ncbi:MAG TPA: hypothetical protein PLV83_01260 [Bacilli bacterium]|nr:hypothetical protein [Bacilli bacterium]